MTTTAKPTLKQRFKKHTPEIVVVAGTVVAVSAYVYVARRAPKAELSNFFKNAADPTVEAIIGNDNAFAVLTTEAIETLETEHFLTLQEGTAGIYKLMFTEANA